jgi:ribosome modulation factor
MKTMNDSNWITDPKGNRITNKDVSERIEKNNSKINDLKNRMKGRSKADNFRDTVRLRDLENENDYFQERFMKSGYERNEQSIRALFSSSNVLLLNNKNDVSENDHDPFKEGYDAYMRNDRHCPYKQGTEEFDSWVDGWQEAEMDMQP